jgi:hypothetical protein
MSDGIDLLLFFSISAASITHSVSSTTRTVYRLTSFGSEIVVLENAAAFQEIWPCLHLPRTRIGWNGGLSGTGGFAGGFKDKAILVKFPHFGGVNHTQIK